MRLQPAAPRAHTAPPVPPQATLRRRLANLLTLTLLGAPALLGGRALADDPVDAPAEPTAAAVVDQDAADPADAEGVVKLSDLRRPTADAAVRPAGLLHSHGPACHDEGCVDLCDVAPGHGGICGHGGVCGPVCHGPVCHGPVCHGHCVPGRPCGPGLCLLGLPKFTHDCPPGQCGPGHYGPGHCGPGLCLPGLPCLGGVPCLGGLPCLGGGPCLGLPLLGGHCGWVAHLCGHCGGPGQCYWCSLDGIGADANNGRKGLHGKYEHVYALDPNYRDRRTGDVWASSQTGVPMAVPLAPNVRHTMEYGWGMPSSRLVPISRPGPPSWLYGPPAGTTVELPLTHPTYSKNLPFLPEHDHRLPRTGVAFPRTIDNAGNR